MLSVRVLVVDDQETYRRAAASVIDATDGFVLVGTASSGEESLAAVAETSPDLVLMDVNLPGIDGIEATRRLTAAGNGPVVVLLSTYDQEDIDFERSGASAYFPKARFGPEELSAAWAAHG
ncbi:MAG: response regulator [Nocardioidaceae bacterium]